MITISIHRLASTIGPAAYKAICAANISPAVDNAAALGAVNALIESHANAQPSAGDMMITAGLVSLECAWADYHATTAELRALQQVLTQ